MRSKRVNCQVYLEGIQVEFNSISISEAVNAPPTAILSFPADSKVITMLPKTVCHIFWLDDGDIYIPEGSIPNTENFSEGTGNGQYRLIFQGEMSGTAMTFSSSQREIILQFTGFTQNWYNYVAVPYDVKLPDIVKTATLAIKYPSNDNVKEAAKGGLIYFNAESLSTTLTQLANTTILQDHGLVAGLLLILKSLYNQGIYLNKISSAFNIESQIYIYDNADMLKVIGTEVIKDYISKQLTTLDGTTTIAEIFTGLLDHIGYDFCEFAAPVFSENKIRRIFVKPKTHFFSPVLSNTVFDDEIASMRFQRNFDSEPTRILTQSMPTFLTTPNGQENAIISAIVPANVIVTEELSKGKVDENWKPFGLNEEEQCRGIIVGADADSSGIEEAYYNIAIDKVYGPLKSPDRFKEEMAKHGNSQAVSAVVKNDVLPTPTNNQAAKNLQFYHLSLMNIAYLDQRYAARTAMLSTPFNPFRLIGFPGLILTKYFATLQGILSAVQTSISADGSATQNLTFTHIRTFNIASANAEQVVPTAEFAWMDDAFQNPPFWYSKFAEDWDAFYKPVTGIDKSSLNKYANNDFKKAVSVLKQKYEDAQKTNSSYKFITQVTRRVIPSKTQILSAPEFKREPRVLIKDAPVSWKDQDKMKESMFVKERRDRVLQLFDLAEKSFIDAQKELQ